MGLNKKQLCKLYNPDDLEISLGKKICLKLICEECNNTSIVNLDEAKMFGSYIHCKHCDTYYKILFNIKEDYSIKDLNRKMHLELFIDKIGKKELFDKIINEDIEYNILEED